MSIHGHYGGSYLTGVHGVDPRQVEVLKQKSGLKYIDPRTMTEVRAHN